MTTQDVRGGSQQQAGSAKPSYLRTCAAVLAYIREHPDCELQEKQGSKFTISWWWLCDRKTKAKIHCNGNAAKAAWKRLKTASPNEKLSEPAGGEGAQ